jgi:hypothetical protein
MKNALASLALISSGLISGALRLVIYREMRCGLQRWHLL